jgi:hypothetical protein
MTCSNTHVHPQITDSVTQSTSHVVGLGPAVAANNAYLGQAQALTVLFANMVNQQQQLALTSLAATTRNVGRLMRQGAAGGAGAACAAPVSGSVQSFSVRSDGTVQHPHPVVT